MKDKVKEGKAGACRFITAFIIQNMERIARLSQSLNLLSFSTIIKGIEQLHRQM
jgi:hypothetical protein